MTIKIMARTRSDVMCGRGVEYAGGGCLGYAFSEKQTNEKSQEGRQSNAHAETTTMKAGRKGPHAM